MSKNKQKEEIVEVEQFYIDKENRRKKREINKKKKDKYKKIEKWK